MADVSILVALIAGAAGVAGASIPLLRETREAKRARSDQRKNRWQQACLDLLQAAQLLRTKIANAAQYHGPEMGNRLEEIRASEADVQVRAASAALYGAKNLAVLADKLSEAATKVTAQTIGNANMQVGEIDPKPDLDELTTSINAFRKAVVSEPGN